MDSIVKDERGMALVGAFLMLLLMGALVSATFGPTLLEGRLAENTRRSSKAFDVAEYGLVDAVGQWSSYDWNALAVWDSTSFTGSVPNGAGTYEGTVRRLSDDVFLMDVTGWDASQRARRRVAQLLKLQLLEIDIQAALTTRGPTKIGGSAEINGNDTHPGQWACGAADSSMSGVRVADAGDLETTGTQCSDGGCLFGNPPVEVDTTVSEDTFFQYGDVGWDELVAMADLLMASGTYKIQPSVIGGVCNVVDKSNWGDPLTPTSPCFGRFPIIYAPGDLTVNGDVGQGILLVGGDLSVQGGFEFYGIVIVRGRLKTTGTGGHFNGSLMAANVDLDDNTVLGDALVQFSSCVVRRALAAASPGAPLRSRGWLQPFN
jgi:hypothetical protein